GRIREPDAAVALDHDVVRRVEAAALVVVGEHGDAAVPLRARDAARTVLAADEATLAVPRVTVGVVGWVAEGADRLPLDPAQDAVVGDVAPHEEVAVREITGPLCPARAGIQLLQPAVAAQEFAEVGLDDLVVVVHIGAPRCCVPPCAAGSSIACGGPGEK